MFKFSVENDHQQCTKIKIFHIILNTFLSYTSPNCRSLYSVLVKNSIVTDNNKTLIVEVLRSIAETVIWGDQNDPRVFE